MVELGEQGVVIAAADQVPEISAVDLRVLGVAQGRGHGQRILMEEGVAGLAALISQRSYRVETQIVCAFERIMIDKRGGQGLRENLDANGAGGRESIRAEGCNRVRVRGIARETVHIRGNGINNPAVRQRLDATRRAWSAPAQRRKHDQPRILDDIRRVSDLNDVVSQTVTAAEHQAIAEVAIEQRLRSPGKTDLG